MPRSDLRTLAARVRWRRNDLGLTQVQLAAKAGIGQSAISTIEGGGTQWMQGPNLLRMALALDVAPEWLEAGEGPMQEKHAPPDYAITDVWSALTPENRQRLLGIAKLFLAEQAERRPSAADPFPNAPKPTGRKVR